MPVKENARKGSVKMTIEEIQVELQEEIDLCNKYFIEEDMQIQRLVKQQNMFISNKITPSQSGHSGRKRGRIWTIYTG